MRSFGITLHIIVDISHYGFSLTTGAGELTKKCVDKAVTWRGKCTGKCTQEPLCRLRSWNGKHYYPCARIKLSQGAQIHTAAHERPNPPHTAEGRRP